MGVKTSRLELIAKYFRGSRKEFRFDHTSRKESLIVSEQEIHGKNTFKGILVYIREINLKASGSIRCRGFENEGGKADSLLGFYIRSPCVIKQ